jgi:hypothetical protein
MTASFALAELTCVATDDVGLTPAKENASANVDHSAQGDHACVDFTSEY